MAKTRKKSWKLNEAKQYLDQAHKLIEKQLGQTQSWLDGGEHARLEEISDDLFNIYEEIRDMVYRMDEK